MDLSMVALIWFVVGLGGLIMFGPIMAAHVEDDVRGLSMVLATFFLWPVTIPAVLLWGLWHAMKALWKAR